MELGRRTGRGAGDGQLFALRANERRGLDDHHMLIGRRLGQHKGDQYQDPDDHQHQRAEEREHRAHRLGAGLLMRVVAA